VRLAVAGELGPGEGRQYGSDLVEAIAMMLNGNGVIELPSGRLYVRGGEAMDEPEEISGFREALNAFVSRDEDTKLLKERAIVLSKREEPVLVQGESGTGKELIAKILHGERRGRFVAVNVCAVTETLFESELFGHIKGSFTGAVSDRTGLIREADGGTLFLDEIGDMAPALQAKMLRVIQNRTFRRVGSNRDEPVNCRIITATHRNLREMIRKGEFRLDLYERLQVFRLAIKPLRERLRDMELYTGTKFLYSCTFLERHRDNLHFSGNVRQLMNLKLKWEVFGESSFTLDDVN
jgi:transcriptional regulator with PAS, ATPase and Fis domain